MTTVHQLSQDEAKRAAIEAGREALREEGRDEVRATIVQEAVNASSAALQRQQAAMEAAHKDQTARETKHAAAHLKAVREGRLALGMCIGIVIGSLAASAGIAYVFKDAQLTSAAARGIEQRGGASVLPAPTLCDPATEQCLPDTNDRDSGYVRPGREPRDAR